MSFYKSFNCGLGNHDGCNEFHLGCICSHHPLGKHLSGPGRYSFVDVDTYPSATVEELETHTFYDAQKVERQRKRDEEALLALLG